MHATFRGRIAGGEDNPVFGKPVFAEPAIENKLIAACLGHLGSGSQLIEEQDASPAGRQKPGRDPFRGITCDAGKATQVDRVELHSSHVEEVVVELFGDLRDDLGLAYAACAPDVQRHTLTDKREKRFVKHGWFHGLSLEGGVLELRAEEELLRGLEEDSSLRAPGRPELALDPLADEVVAVFVLEQLHRGVHADSKDHLEHRFVFEFKIDVERLFKLVNVNGFDRFSLGTAKRYLRVAMPERHREA
jgi:hypothetical protein